MNESTLEDYYQRATKKLPHPAAAQIIELVEEVRRLRRMMLRKGLHPIGAEEPWPYRPYVGIPLAEVPEDYLIDWMNRQNRNGLKFDVEYAAIALRDLLLYDYIRKLATPPNEEIPQAAPQTNGEDLPEGSYAIEGDTLKMVE